jgi:hypothetical protein
MVTANVFEENIILTVFRAWAVYFANYFYLFE